MNAMREPVTPSNLAYLMSSQKFARLMELRIGYVNFFLNRVYLQLSKLFFPSKTKLHKRDEQNWLRLKQSISILLSCKYTLIR
jgi:hypothetical protein